jgi:sodium/proline symporter
MESVTISVLIIYLSVTLVIGYMAYRLTNNLSDYILGGRNLSPSVAALSAGASDMSSWLLLGLPGYAYAAGMDALWISVGLTIGAYLNWQFVARRLRSYTEVANDSITIPDFFENRFRDKSKSLRVISALVTLVFFTFYTSAGLVGGALLFQESFGMTYNQALWIGALVIISYTFLGGFLAASWTDFIQGSLMILAIIIVPIIAIQQVGGWNDVVSTVAEVNPSHLNALDGLGFIAIASLVAWGLGYFGQPHIIVRFMAIRSVKDVPLARFIGMAWMVAGLIGAIFIGFAGIAYFADAPLIVGDVDNSEKVFIFFADVLFNPWVSGILLAAILSAIMSTIDSQLLVSSSALAEDFYKSIFRKKASQRELIWIGRFGVLAIALLAIMLAIQSNPAKENASSILDLVSYAWGGFGAAFGPVVILSLFWKRMTRNGALAGMIVGALTVVVWKQLSGAYDGIFNLYEIVPGFLLGWIVIMVVSILDKEPSQEIQEEFEKATAMSR